MIRLPAEGRFIIDTEVDTYDVDLDCNIAIWHDMAREAEGEHVEPQLFIFDTVDVAVGVPIRFDDGEHVGAIVVGFTPVTVNA